MKKNLIMILAIVLLCCGCKAEYTLKINEDGSVSEVAKGLEGVDFYSRYPNSSVQHVIGFLIEPHLDYLNKYGYTITEMLNSDKAGVQLTNRFDSLEKYLSTSKAAKQYGSEIEYIEKDGKITLKIVGKLGEETQEQNDQYVIEEGIINISLPNRKVISHNADSYDEENETYTWKVDNVNTREISITFAKEANKYFPLVEIFAIAGFIAVCIASGYFYTKVIMKKDSRNKV